MALSLAEIAILGGNAFAFIYHHALLAETVIHAFIVLQRAGFVAVAFHVHQVVVKYSIHHFAHQITIELLPQTREPVVRH